MLEFVYVSIDSVSGIIFYDFVANSVRNFFLATSKHQQAKCCLFLVFVGAASSFTDKISSLKTVAKQEAILNLIPKQ